MGRRLNKIWGEEQRASDPQKIAKKLMDSQKIEHPKSPIATAMKLRKTLWIGRKSDPYQPIELSLNVTRGIVRTLVDLNWSYVICTRYPSNAIKDKNLFLRNPKLCSVLIEITPGEESDWEIFERERTDPIDKRLKIARTWKACGINIGIRGEPFIAGYHTTAQFRSVLKRIKSYGINSYNTYNLHMNEYTLKRLHSIGLDIERIWNHNQNAIWGKLQRELCQIADEEGVCLGCPDFVNQPANRISMCNTCCGVNVPNPFKYNTHSWRNQILNGGQKTKVLQDSWESIGNADDKSRASTIIFGRSKDLFTMKDAGL
jgi:DNA repair photolyase